MTHTSGNGRQSEHDMELDAWRQVCQRYIDFLDQSYLTGRNVEEFDGWTVTIAATGDLEVGEDAATMLSHLDTADSDWPYTGEYPNVFADGEAEATNGDLDSAETAVTMLDGNDTADEPPPKDAPNSRPVDEAALGQAAEMIGMRWVKRGGSFDLLGREDNLSLGTVWPVDDLDWGAFTRDGRAMFFDDLATARCALLEMAAASHEATVAMSPEDEKAFFRQLREMDGWEACASDMPGGDKLEPHNGAYIAGDDDDTDEAAVAEAMSKMGWLT